MSEQTSEIRSRLNHIQEYVNDTFEEVFEKLSEVEDIVDAGEDIDFESLGIKTDDEAFLTICAIMNYSGYLTDYSRRFYDEMSPKQRKALVQNLINNFHHTMNNYISLIRSKED